MEHAYGLYTHIQANKRRSIALLIGLFFLVYLMVFAGALAARDLRYWNARRASAQVVPAPADPDKVHFGSTVTIQRDDGRRQTYRIVGEDASTCPNTTPASARTRRTICSR